MNREWFQLLCITEVPLLLLDVDSIGGQKVDQRRKPPTMALRYKMSTFFVINASNITARRSVLVFFSEICYRGCRIMKERPV